MAAPAAAPSGALSFHLTEKSKNEKTGPMPVSTSSAATCPKGDICPFKGNGCYAEAGPLALHWRAVTEGSRGMPWAEFLAAISALPKGQLWRHNQAGDIVDPNTATGRKMLTELTGANSGRRGFTYTHHRRGKAAVAALKAATANGFTVNASCNTEREADAAIAAGLRAVFVVPSGEDRPMWKTADGNRAIVCPAQRFEGMNCTTCRLCQARPQNVAIAFVAHGTQKRKVDAVLAQLVSHG